MALNPDLKSPQDNFKSDLVFFASLSILLLFIYGSTRHAGFVTDFWGWQKEYGSCSLWELWQCANIKSLQHFQHFFVAAFYKVFGISGWAWTIASVSLFMLFLWSLFGFWRKIFEFTDKKPSQLTLRVAILLVAISPYSAEVLVWRVCLHYIMAGIFLLISAIQWLDYLSDGNKRRLWTGSILFAFALGTLELSLVYPLFILPAAWYLFRIKPAIVPGFKSRMFILISVSFILITCFFLVSKWVLGAWIGHYGAETHAGLKVNEFAIHYYQYFVKHIALIRFLPHQIKTSIFELFSTGYSYLFILLLVLGVSLLMLRSALKRQFAPEWIGVWGFLVFLLPVGNLYFMYLQLNENDRYGFVPAALLMSALVLLISRLDKKFSYVLYAIILFFNGFYLLKMRSVWTQNGEVYQALVKDFRWYDKDFVFILNIPDNFEGTPMFRVLNSDSGLGQALLHTRKEPYSGKIVEVAMYNMIDDANGVTATWLDEKTISVDMHEWGSWWWMKGQGLGNHSNEWYEYTSDGKSYKLSMKSYPADAVFIYQDGKQWKELIK